MFNRAEKITIPSYMRRGLQEEPGSHQALDIEHCPNCGERSISAGEVRQVEIDSSWVHQCTACGELTDP